MTETSIQVTPSSMALSSENYQTFEMAKANDGILGGDDIAQIRSYAAWARAQAQAIHKTIAATNGIEDVAAIKAEATETAQTFAKVGIYADQRIGEILRELPKAKAGRKANSVATPTELTKGQAEKQAGIGHSTAIDLQAMAANPEVVEAVIAKATEEGRVVSRKQVLDAIAEKKRAERERDEARQDLQDAYLASENAELEAESLKRQVSDARAEIAALEKQNDELYAQKNPEPQVVEREVVREVESEEAKRRIESLEYYKNLGDEDNRKLRRRNEELRKKLDRAKVLLEEKGYEDNASWDISALTTATNQYLRNYGGKAWAFDQFYRVDEVTQQEFVKAITSLAAFSQNLVQMISDQNKLGA